MKNKKLIFLSIVLLLALVSNCRLFAKDDLAQLKDSYFKSNRYSEFVNYLKRQKQEDPARISYYIALTRHKQLQHLEETQDWEEYFNRGEEYRQEFLREAQDALKSSPEDAVSVYARSLLWQFHKDMRDQEEEAALKDLLDAVKQYSGSAGADLSVIKEVADTLSDYGERKDSQKVYNIYLEKLSSSLEEKEKIAKLISLARELAYQDDKQGNPFFAEEIFQKINQLNPGLILDEQTQNLRAYNLEKIKQYKDAYAQYRILVDNYPKTSHYAEALFKMGVISAYILRDIPSAQGYFAELAKSSALNPQACASLYQLGLLSQYQGDISRAEEYYNALLDRSEEGSYCGDLINKAKLRLKEIEEDQPLEFNLKTFMDASLGEGKGEAVSPNVDIKAQRFGLTLNQDVSISSLAFPQATGCMPVSIEYLWSGDLGSALPGSDEDSFVTHYVNPGTKLVMFTAVTPLGILDCDLIFLDVTEN